MYDCITCLSCINRICNSVGITYSSYITHRVANKFYGVERFEIV